MERSVGTLYLCATPIGNLEDITLRVLRVLREVDLIAAEDTRRARKLLSHFEIHTPVTSYFEHNRHSKGRYLIKLLEEGKNLALISDAGLPGISDPGAELVKEALDREIRVVALPGPSAAITALVVSGLPTRRFAFEGFLPSSAGPRRKRIRALIGEERTMIFYEAPHRLRQCLADMLEIWGDRRAAVARELTKYYEEVDRGSLSELVELYSKKEPRGEFTIVVEGAGCGAACQEPGHPGTAQEMSPARQVAELIASGLRKQEAIKKVARATGIPRREVYRAIVESREIPADEDEPI